MRMLTRLCIRTCTYMYTIMYLPMPPPPPPMLLSHNTCSMAWVEIEGTVYRREGVVMTESHLLPEFAIIEDIVVTEKMECYLLCKECETLHFHHHYHSFEVRLTPDLIAVNPRDLADFHVLSIQRLTSFPSSLFVCLKYHVIESI